MGLINRLAGISDTPGDENIRKLGVNTFWALLYELSQGKVTQAQVVSYFDLDSDEQSELQWLINRYNAQPNATAKAKFVELLKVIFMLAEDRVPGYTTNAQIVARLSAI